MPWALYNRRAMANFVVWLVRIWAACGGRIAKSEAEEISAKRDLSVPQMKKGLEIKALIQYYWCPERDSNPHGVTR